MGFVANIVNDAVDFVEEVADSAGYFITGNYEGDNGDNTITAVGVAVWGSGIKTYGGNDTVHAASLKLDVYDTWGNLSVHGAAGFMNISKTDWGNISVYGAAGATNIQHTGRSGNITYGGVAASNYLYLSGNSGNITFVGAGIKNQVINSANRGNISFEGIGASNIVKRIGGSFGNINFKGGGGSNKVINSANDGNINFVGVGISNQVSRLGGYRGNISFVGIGVGNHIVNTAQYGNIDFVGGGGANIIDHASSGYVFFTGIGIANVITQTGDRGDLRFIGGGAANIIRNTARIGNINVVAAGIGNYIERSGQEGDGDLTLLGGGNVVVWSTHGRLNAKLGGARINVLNRTGHGNTNLILVSLGNIVNVKVSKGDLNLIGAGVANVVTYEGRGNLNAYLIGGANVITRFGFGHSSLYLLAGANIFTDFSVGDVSGTLFGGLNVVTKKGRGNIDIVMWGGGNVLTHIGRGNIKVNMLGGGNIITKVGNGDVWALMFGGLNVFTHVGKGNNYLLMLGVGNVATKTGDGDVIVGMFGVGNVLTHVGNGMTAALMVSVGGNIFTKVGDGPTFALMLSLTGNIFTHIGDGPSAALMLGGQANIFTKVGDGITVAVMVAGQANVFTHVGDGFSAALMLGGQANIFTKIGDGTTLAVMVGGFNVFTHIGNGFSAAFAIGQANIVTKVGSGDLITAAIGQANIVTHINLEGNGNTMSLVVGRANIVTRVSSLADFSVTVSPLDSVVSDPVLDRHRLFPRGDVFSAPQKFLTSGIDALKATGVALLGKNNEGSMVTFAVGQANIITHIGNGAMLAVGIGQANIISKVGLGQTIQAGIGKANILTSVGDNDSLQIAIGKANIVTKVGSGYSSMIAIGKVNITTKVGDGFHLGASIGKFNVNTNVGDGVAINVMVGKYNLNTRVGHGVNVAAMKGDYNANVRYGDGMDVLVAAGKGNISVKIGDGDYYGAMIEMGTKESPVEKMKSLMQGMLSNLKETAKSLLVSQTIATMVNGEDADTTKTRGSSHSTPKKDQDQDYGDTSNMQSVNKNVDQTQYQPTDANQDSDIDTQSQKDKQTVNSLKSDTQVNEEDANKDAQEVTRVLGDNNQSNLMQNTGQGDSQALDELNKIGQSKNHNSYTQFGNVDKVKEKANKDIKDSQSGIEKSKSTSQENLDKSNEKLKDNQLHQQEYHQKVKQDLEGSNQNSNTLNAKQNHTGGPVPIKTNAWQVDATDSDNGVFTIGDEIKVRVTLNKTVTLANVGSNKVVIAGKDFLLTGVNGATTNVLNFTYIVKANDKLNTTFDIDSKEDIVLTGIKDTDGNSIDLSGITGSIVLGDTVSKNLTLNNKNLATVSTNVSRWHNGNTAANIRKMTDGNTSTSGALDYATHPMDANGKHILFDFKNIEYTDGTFKLYNRTGAAPGRINGSIVEFFKNGEMVSTHTIKNAGNIVEISPPVDTFFDQVKLTFSGNLQNFREIEIFGKNQNLLIDSGAPKPLATNAWHIDASDATNGVFTIGDEIKVTLTLDEAVTLANVGRNKIVISGRDFLLTGVNDSFTKTLAFVYTVKANDRISAANFNIYNKDIVLSNIKDADGNAVDLDSVTDIVKLSREALSTDFIVGGGNKITQTNGTYQKTSGADWDADVFSSKGFVGDGYVIAKIGALNKNMMLGLSSDNTNSSSIDYALYANGSTGNKFVIYEHGKHSYDTGVTYANGDYMKVVREGTEIQYYHIKAADGPLATGTLIHTSAKTLNADTKLFLDSSFLSVGAKLSDMQIFNGKNSPLSIDVHAPKPVVNAWHVDASDATNGVFTIGNKIKVTLTLDEAVTLAGVGRNKVVIAGKDFLLTGNNGTTTKTLDFTYTVKVNDRINAVDFDIDNKHDIILANIKDTDGNYVDLSSITGSTKLNATKLNTDLSVSSDNKMSKTNDTYEKTANAAWDTDVFSSEGFMGDGYVIAKIGTLNKRIMLGLSSDNTNSSYNSIDYALYADGGIGNKFVIYEDGVRQKGTGTAYAVGDYMKVVREGTTVKYYHIKAVDGPLAAGNLLYTSTQASSINTKLFLDSSFYEKGAQLSDMQIFSGVPLALSVDVGAPKPVANAWHVNTADATQGVFTIGNEIKVTLTLDEAVTLANVGSNKIVIAGKDFLLKGANGALTKTLEFSHIVQANEKTNTAFYINDKRDIILTDIKDSSGNNINFDDIVEGVDLSPEIQNIALNSKGLATITTNIDAWHQGDAAANIKRMTDGNTSSQGALDYATHPKNADGKYMLFDFGGINYTNGSFKLYNRKAVAHRINGSTVEFLKEGKVVSRRTISSAGNVVEIIPAAGTAFDQVKLTFSGSAQNFREIKIFGKNSNLSIDSGAPEPLAYNAWHVDASTATNGVFAIGDKIKVTLTLDEAVTLAGVGSNKIVIAGTDFLLTGANGVVTDRLNFTYTVQANDKIDATSFDIDNKGDIVLTDIKDKEGNSIDLSSITGPTRLNATKLNTDLSVSSDNKMSKTNDTYEKTANAAWDTDVFSSEGFMGDGYVIAKIGTLNKRIMLGLSSDNTNSSYNSIDYALYADGGIGNKFVIYEDGVRQKGTGTAYAVGDYMKVVREGTTVKYYHIKAVDGPLAAGNLLYTSTQASSINTKLFLDSSFYEKGAQLSDMQIFSGAPLALSVDVGAPKLLLTNPWKVDANNAKNGVFTVGDEIKVTLALDEAVTLANIGSNKIIIAGKDFLLTGANGSSTSTLEFTHTIKRGDGSTSIADFNIHNKNDIILTNIKDIDGNIIDMSSITSSVNLGHIASQSFHVAKNQHLLIDCNAPTPLKSNAWRVNVNDAMNGVFTIDDEIKITLTLDEAVTLANIGSNKIIVAGKDFLLIGANGDITKTLEFSHTVKVGDGRIGAKNFDINNRNDIILDGVKDTDGNVIDLSHITNPVKLSSTLINTDFNIGGGNKITQVGNTYEKTSNNGWNADVSSSKGFVGDGYVIAKIGAIGKRKRMMFGLSDNNTNNSYNSIDYALYANGGIGNRFAIYESGRKRYESNVAYALGDYMKIVKEGATIKYYHIKASDGVLATGTLIYTSDKKVLNANTELFLDSSLHDVGTKLSNVQIFSGNNPTFSMNAKTSTLSTDDASGQSKDILNQTTSGYGRNPSVDSNSNHDSTETSTPDSKTHDKETQDGANGASTKARKEQGKDPSRWFTDKKLNQNFSKGLSFSQTPQVFILTDDSYESLNLGLWLKKENDIVIYYNTKNNKIEYLYGEDNDIETTYVEYKIIANGKTVDTLVEDTINDIYVAIDKKVKIGKKDEVDEGGVEDEIDTASIVAQLKQTIATMRANAGLHKNWLTRRSFEKYNLDFENIFWQREMQAQTPDSTLNSNPNPNSDTSTPKKSRYHSNIIVQNSNDKTVVEAANALFNKHPNNSIIVQFDKDGKLVTLKGDTYTPTGDTRVNFVDHGGNLSQEGAQALANKANKIQQAYGNDKTDINRIALVGCDTDGVRRTLTKDFAKAVYENDILRKTEITGRTTQIEVNPDGTKTMQTGGTKTVYSWDADTGETKQRTEAVKSHREVLTNSLSGYDAQVQKVRQLLQDTVEGSDQHTVLKTVESNLLLVKDTRLEAARLLYFACDALQRHLEKHPDTNIKEQMLELDGFLKQKIEISKKFIASVKERWDKKDKWDVGKQSFISFVKEKIKEGFLSTSDQINLLNEMTNDIDRVLKDNGEAEGIKAFKQLDDSLKEVVEATNDAQEKLKRWAFNKNEVENTKNESISARKKYILILQLDSSATTGRLAGKYPTNSTVIRIDENGNYMHVYGADLRDIPEGNLNIKVVGHGNDTSISGRNPEAIAQYIERISKILPKGADIEKVSLHSCNNGKIFAGRLLTSLVSKLNKHIVVDSRLGIHLTTSNGKSYVFFNDKPGEFHTNRAKVSLTFNKKGDIVELNPYPDLDYHIVLDATKDLSVIQIHETKKWATLTGKLKVKVEAGTPEETKQKLMQLQEKLPKGASIEKVDIILDNEVFAWSSNLNDIEYMKFARDISKSTNTTVSMYHNSKDRVFRAAYRSKYDNSTELSTSGKYIYFYDKMDRTPIEILFQGLEGQKIMVLYNQFNHNLKANLDITFKFNLSNGTHPKPEDIELMLAAAKNTFGEKSVQKISLKIFGHEANKTLKEKENIDKYQAIIRQVAAENPDAAIYLYANPSVSVYQSTGDSGDHLLLSKGPYGKEVRHHFADPAPHQNKPLQDWSELSDEQRQKLKTESEKTKPSLVNNDHHIIVQGEDDVNARQGAINLASKHPGQTTIVQMDKQGNLKVAYGTKLKDITGKVKISVIGYGREESGNHTLSGRNPEELSANIAKLKKELKADKVSVQRVSLVSCNLDSGNPTDDQDGSYGEETLKKLQQAGLTDTDVVVRRQYVDINPDGTKVTSDTGVSNWKHKESKTKRVYSLDVAGNVVVEYYDNQDTLTDSSSRYKTNIVLQLSNDETVKNATQALANKHPENSYIAKMDADGNIKVYNLKGNEVNLDVGDKYRINVVGHGSEMKTLGAQALTQHIQNLQTQLKIDIKDEGRINLVGCETDIASNGDVNSLTKSVAERLYDNGKGTTKVEVTGRTTQIEVNPDGRKTMQTGGTKTVYSWNLENGIVKTTEHAKSTTDVLTNPLDNFGEQIEKIRKLLEQKQTNSKHKAILSELLDVFVRTRESGFSNDDNFSKMYQIELDLEAHLNDLVKVSKIDRPLRELLTFTHSQIEGDVSDVEREFSRLTENDGSEVSKLVDFHKLLLSPRYADHPKIVALRESSLEKIKTSVENAMTTMIAEQHGLDVDELVQVKKHVDYLQKHLTSFEDRKATQDQWKALPSPDSLLKWQPVSVSNKYSITPKDEIHRVVVILEDDGTMIDSSAAIAGKYYNNSTLIQMDEQGNYKVLHGPRLKDITGEVKILFDGHGDEVAETTGGRSATDIVDHIVRLKQDLPSDTKVKQIDIKGCNSGFYMGKHILTGAKAKNIDVTVSTRLGGVITEDNGRQTVDGAYHLDDKKIIWEYNEQGEITQKTELYPDTKYHLVVTVGKEGAFNYNKNDLLKFKNNLRVRVIASTPEETLETLKKLKQQLHNDGIVPMAQIDIRMGKGSADWTNEPDMYAFTENLLKYRAELDANILVHNDSGPNKGSMAFADNNTFNQRVKIFRTNPAVNFVFYDSYTKDVVGFNYLNRESVILLNSSIVRPSVATILKLTLGTNDYSKDDLLTSLKNARDLNPGRPHGVIIVTDGNIIQPSLDKHKELVAYLSDQLKMRVVAYHSSTGQSVADKPWLSKSPLDPKVIEHHAFEHLADPAPHQDKPLQDWSDLSDDQRQKLKTESEKTKPTLANHDHQIILQTEDHKNVGQSALDLASKHPGQTTIVQIDKEGNLRVVYGTKLQDIKGTVKVSAIGYGREEGGVHTLGGRNANELSKNIIKLKQGLDSSKTTIGRISAVGCNLKTNNPTDDQSSGYGEELLKHLKQSDIGDDVSVSVRSKYVGINPDGTKVTSDTGTSNWKHKDGEAKTTYEMGKNGVVTSRSYDNNGILVRYNGQHLGKEGSDDNRNPSKYKTNIILELPGDDTVKNAAQALANKHPENSYIAKMDADGNIKVYNLKGNEVNLDVGDKYRINVVGHGSEMKTLGAQALIQHIQNLQTQLKIDIKDEGRINLVGCETDIASNGDVNSLTKSVAERLYDNGKGTTKVEVTGRTTQIEVNPDGRKTMQTGGTKTVYSWNLENGIVKTTEHAKSTTDVLTNPLDNFGEQIEKIRKLLKQEQTNSKHKAILSELLDVFVRTRESGFSNDDNFSKMYQIELDLEAHLNDLVEVSKIDRPLRELLTFTHSQIEGDVSDVEREFSRLTENDGSEVSKLVDFHKLLLSPRYADHPKIVALRESSLEKIKTSVENAMTTMIAEQHGLDVDELVQVKKHVDYLQKHLTSFEDRKATQDQWKALPPPDSLLKWQPVSVSNKYSITPKDEIHRVVVILEDDRTIIDSSVAVAGKYYNNSTLIQMDEQGNYKVLHGPRLKDITGEVKILFDGHGNKVAETTGGRSATDIVDHIVRLKQDLPSDTKVKQIDIKGCNSGLYMGKHILTGAKAKNIDVTVSTRLGRVITENNGRKTVDGAYHLDDKKIIWEYNEQGEITQKTELYPDTKYHLVVTVGKEGAFNYNKNDLLKFKNNLRVRVIASTPEETLETLKKLKQQLHNDGIVPMAQIDIRMGKGSADWSNEPDMYAFTENLLKYRAELDANILVHNDSGPNKGSMAFTNNNTLDQRVKIWRTNPAANFVFNDSYTKNVVGFSYFNRVGVILLNSSIVRPDVATTLKLTLGTNDYSKDDLLTGLKNARDLNPGRPYRVIIVTDGNIIQPSLDKHKELVAYLSDQLKIRVVAYHSPTGQSVAYDPWLSKSPLDPKVIGHHTFKHLADPAPHQDKPLQDWSDLSDDQRQKLKTESEITKPTLANHDHQVLIQGEDDANVKQSTLDLASKHPGQTTIVQISKDGSRRVVYGPKLKDIAGKVKIVAVGYGREDNGVHTLGGRSPDELSDNIVKLNQDLDQSKVTIGVVSMLGCNLGADNPTDNSNSTYGSDTLIKLREKGVSVDEVRVRNTYVGINPDGTKVTSSTGDGEWIHKDSKAKLIYSFNATGEVISKVYDNEGTLIKYNGQDIGESDTNDNKDQQDADDKQQQQDEKKKQLAAEAERTKQKLNDIDKLQTDFANSVDQSKLKRPLNNQDDKDDKKKKKKKKTPPSFNVQIDIGNGDHATFFGGSNNLDIKVGNGAHHTLMYGDNNVLISIGSAGNTDRFVKIGDYRALEGVQVLIGNKNIVVNHGVRNDLIIATDPSFPMIPFVNPFDGSANVLGSLKKMSALSNSEQNALWSWKKTAKFAVDMSSLDSNSDTVYKDILTRGSQNKVSDRGLKYDVEMTLNKKSNEFMQMSQQKQQQKQSFKDEIDNFSLNLTIGGQGSDILIGNGNFSFMFGDTVSSVLDTTVASLFGIMQQEFTKDGQPGTTFTYTPANQKTQFINSMLNEVASHADDVTFGDILGYEYADNGAWAKTNARGYNLSISEILKGLLGTVSDTFENSIQALSEPERIVNALKASWGTVADMAENTYEALGMKEAIEGSKKAAKKAEEEKKAEDDSVKPDDKDKDDSKDKDDDKDKAKTGTEKKKAFGFGGIKLPSLFDLTAKNLIETLQDLPALAKTLASSISSISSEASNIKEETVKFFSDSGHMTNDGDLFFNIGAQNFAWGGDGKDLFALMGTNNNVWGGRGDDVAYVIGEGNTISGNEGNDSAVYVGQNHMFIGGEGNDVAVASGRYNTLFGGTGEDQLWAFGERAYITGNKGDDYLVSTGNYGKVYGNEGDDVGILIGAYNRMDLGEGDDHGKVFGNRNRVYLASGNDELEVASHQSFVFAESGNDYIYMHKNSTENQIDAGEGDDLLYLGGEDNVVIGGSGADVFVVGNDNISSILSVDGSDYITFDLNSYQDTMYYRDNNDLLIKHQSLVKPEKPADDDSNIEIAKQYRSQDGEVLIEDYFSDTDTDASGVKICIDIDTKNNRYHYLEKEQVSKLVEYMSTFDSFADTTGDPNYQKEVNQLWSKAQVGYNVPSSINSLT